MNTVSVIPVRGVDAGIGGSMPELGGRSLLAYTVLAALSASNIDRVIVSTDSPTIRELAETLGAEAPFLRPAALADPRVPIESVLLHAVDWIEQQGDSVDAVVPLEISHPIRPPGVVERVVEMLATEAFDTVFAVLEIKAALWSVDEWGDLHALESRSGDTRATRRPIYRELAGLASAVRVSVLRRGVHLGGRVGIVPIRDLSALVDTQDESGLELARLLLESGALR